MPNGDPTKPSLPGKPQDWINGVIGAALVGFLSLQNLKVGDIQVDQDGNEKDIDQIVTTINEVASAAEDTRRVYMKKINQIQDDLEEIKALLEKETP